MPDVAIIGGGLAGLSAAAALGGAGYTVDVYEARAFLGGRATSYPVNTPGEVPETIDNCQHILLRCCVNLVDFYKRLQVADRIQFHREFFFIEPGGRVSTLKSGRLPAPLHFAESFLSLKCLSFGDKLALARAILALRSQAGKRGDLDQITMLDWLREQKQPEAVIERFWRQVLVSAINEELHLMAASHGFQVFRLGFLATSNSYEMGIPSIPLGDLYGPEIWSGLPAVKLHLRSPVETLDSLPKHDAYVVAVPFERLPNLAPQVDIDVSPFTHSPIAGIHLWFDRSITGLPHATLLDRTIQWMFNKGGGRYIQLVVSAARSLTEMKRADVIELAVRELGEFFPKALEAKLEKAHVVKEIRATFSAQPDLELKRPGTVTNIPNVFLAGDWTRSGWPATMEGAVRSGYIAAEAVTAAAGNPRKFLLPDIA